jgi:hypothetical protein
VYRRSRCNYLLFPYLVGVGRRQLRHESDEPRAEILGLIFRYNLLSIYIRHVSHGSGANPYVLLSNSYWGVNNLGIKQSDIIDKCGTLIGWWLARGNSMATSSTTNITSYHMELNPGLRGEKLKSNRLKCSMITWSCFVGWRCCQRLFLVASNGTIDEVSRIRREAIVT